MIKGIGILYVIVCHMMAITSINAPAVVTSLGTPVMIIFFLFAGYTTTIKSGSPAMQIIRKAVRLLGPYYTVVAVMAPVLFVIYFLIEKRSLAFYIDGLLGILFQLQSFHAFDPSSAGVHPMFYGVLIGWFLFQMTVSYILFIPLKYVLDRHKAVWKLISALAMFLIGAGLYLLNLQGLNGEFFPPVCKIFILPNIPGIAGVMLLGDYFSYCSLLDEDRYVGIKRVTGLIGIVIIALFVVTDDGIYDFPIGKWGAFGPYSYFLSPVYMMAVLMVLLLACRFIKRIPVIMKILTHFGDNSMDYLVWHFYIGYLTAYIGGFWYDFLSAPAPDYDIRVRSLHYCMIQTAAILVPYGIIRLKRLCKNVK